MADAIPVWLYTLPDGPSPRPPVVTREQTLPFGELSWANFERLIVRLVRREGDIVECSLYGTPGQAQEGLDILASHRDDMKLRVCYQCKKVTQFGPADIVAAVDSFLSGSWAEKSREFVLCVAVPFSSTQQQEELDRQRDRLAAKSIKLSTWDAAPGGALSERLKSSPELVDDFFGRPWLQRFNGAEAAGILGERLSGYELGTLRSRLLNLYTALFAQHDPGLRVNSDKSIDIRKRYVPADVLERTEAAPASTGAPQQTAREDENATAQSAQAGSTSGGRLAAYAARRPVLGWLRDQQNSVLLGEPGYGKSTLLRYVALSSLHPISAGTSDIDPDFYSRLPVWMSFARFSAAIDREASISVSDFFEAWLHQHSFGDVYPLFKRAASGGQVLLMVDGLDEATSEHTGREALDRIVTFLDSFRARILCTSRPRGYQTLGVPRSWTTATLVSFSDEQIELFATRWFAILEPGVDHTDNTDVTEHHQDRAQAFLRAARISQKTLELARNPLLCQVLIQLFRDSHQLPEARVTAYQQIVELLLSRHPAARAQAGGVLQPVSRLDLRPDDLKEILIRLAWELQVQLRVNPLSRAGCEQVCTEFLEDSTFGLGETRARARRLSIDVVEQLVTQYGVLVERAPGEFNFVHLSVQEYLAAEYMARQPAEHQLAWLSRVWLKPAWKESLISWFGVLGTRGDKVLSRNAAKRLFELGEVGAWQRLQSLELRTEIATADLGLPVIEARRIVEESVETVETSPFSELRTTLARNIAVGALGSTVRSECQSAVRRWMPGHSEYHRTRLLEAFKTWTPSRALHRTLLRSLHDESVRCRRAAVESFVAVFHDSETTLPELKQLAFRHVQPQVRAIAIHGLGCHPEWSTVAAEAATENISSSDAELLLVASNIRVRQRLHDDADLDRVWRLWINEAVDFWLRDELTPLLCEGWPTHPALRRHFIEKLENASSTAGLELPLEYLIRCYPGDPKVAQIIAKLLRTFENHFVLQPERIWEPMRAGFRQNTVVASAIRTMLQSRREKYKAIFWDPQTTPAFTVLDDDEARDDLLTSYETADPRERYWIANALFKGWTSDTIVKERLKDWVGGPDVIAAPLAKWGDQLIPDAAQRRTWLLRLVETSASIREIDPIVALLKEFPDSEAKKLTGELLEHPKVWYYHRMKLQGLFALKFPDDPRALEIVDRSLSEIDGPNPGDFAEAFQHNAQVADRLLAAAVTAPVDVRMAVATILRERAVDEATVNALTPLPFAEESSSVRTSCLMARAQAVRSNTQATHEFSDELMAELGALGSVMDKRRRSALAGLLGLGQYQRIAEAFKKENSANWGHWLIDRLDGDPVSLTALIEHWSLLKPLLQQDARDAELPVAEIVYAGYGALLEQTALGQKALDAYFETNSRDWLNSAYLDTFARRHSNSQTMQHRLLTVLGSWRSHGNLSCTAARLLARQPSAISEFWTELSGRHGTVEQALPHLGAGVLGYAVNGWPDGVAATWVRSVPAEQRTRWSPRDRLLIAVTEEDANAAETAARDMLSEPIEPWWYRYDKEDSEALRVWAESGLAATSLAQWIVSDNSSRVATAATLIAGSHTAGETHAATLLRVFNAQLMPGEKPPLDGLNAAAGSHTSLAGSLYSAMGAISSAFDHDL